jgi:hypothetical protein
LTLDLRGAQKRALIAPIVRDALAEYS